jgi:hypothetical protein
VLYVVGQTYAEESFGPKGLVIVPRPVKRAHHTLHVFHDRSALGTHTFETAVRAPVLAFSPRWISIQTCSYRTADADLFFEMNQDLLSSLDSSTRVVSGHPIYVVMLSHPIG